MPQTKAFSMRIIFWKLSTTDNANKNLKVKN